MTKDEVLQQALEALNKLADVFLDTEGNHGDYEQKALNQGNKTILAIKAALAQPEQEPVAWMLGDDDFQDARCYVGVDGDIPLFTSPPRRQPLTDEQIAEVAERMEATDAASSFWREFARAIEAANGIGDKT